MNIQYKMNAWSNLAYLENEIPVSHFLYRYFNSYRNMKRNLKRYFIKCSKKMRLGINMKTGL